MLVSLSDEASCLVRPQTNFLLKQRLPPAHPWLLNLSIANCTCDSIRLVIPQKTTSKLMKEEGQKTRVCPHLPVHAAALLD